MQRIAISSDQKSFVFQSSGERFIPWGHNYAAQGLDESTPQAWEKIERDLVDLRAMHANVIRIHLPFPEFMVAPDQPNPEALKRLAQLLSLAEKHHMYLDITGLANYRKSQRVPWYDALPDAERWSAQARFWEAIAQTCAGSPAVFCYDLVNEPITFGKRSDGWYTGEFGGYEFLQRLSLDEPHGNPEEVARQWTYSMVAAIRRVDPHHLITLGMLPAWGIPPRAVAPELDFIAVHLYPTTGQVPGAIDNLRQFDLGKPIVIEETFPLSCSIAEEKQFILESRNLATGWIGHYPDQSLGELQLLQQRHGLSLAQKTYLAWLDLFRELTPIVLSPSRPSNESAPRSTSPAR